MFAFFFIIIKKFCFVVVSVFHHQNHVCVDVPVSFTIIIIKFCSGFCSSSSSYFRFAFVSVLHNHHHVSVLFVFVCFRLVFCFFVVYVSFLHDHHKVFFGRRKKRKDLHKYICWVLWLCFVADVGCVPQVLDRIISLTQNKLSLVLHHHRESEKEGAKFLQCFFGGSRLTLITTVLLLILHCLFLLVFHWLW